MLTTVMKTVDAEIKAAMTVQRACDAEMQAGNKLSNGPLRAQSNVNSKIGHRVFCDAGQALYAGDMMVSR